MCRTIEAVNWLRSILQAAFTTITEKQGPIVPYLGMQFDFTPNDYVAINAEQFINGLLDLHNVTEFSDYPADSFMRICDDSLPRLPPKLAEAFHSLAYKFLYLAKRYRFDLLPIAQFLTTRVHISTAEDMQKAQMALNYLNSTRELELRLNAKHPTAVICFIDASHAVNPKRRSQGASCIGLGRGHIHAATASLKQNTKSSLESEYIATADNVTDAIYVRNYLLELGYTVPAATIYQDNEAAIKLCNNGMNSAHKSRHIDIRHFFIEDRVATGHIEIKYVNTNDMIADYLTKPLMGSQFYKLRDLLLGYTTL
jgi:hypothetical protein